ncbi:AAA family ATPase [Algoriphagus yeomjeoni]|uniref:Putative AbiEii toxin of type IV toxin-antitoxin system n=1 Tax=Algoriphagus yeomjeoni TaxID=291403 RepID=A0A327P3H1_9BACT|nr:AAA family ATPase [Algoriphagus yeomjeoni]RAI86808.1 putative AbiEii toxin of type IV toxin-antitoxin system [Algoriphagus yeomjeoni]
MKILAIIPLSEEHCKNLKLGEVYKFYNDYRIERTEKGEVIVERIGKSYFDLYRIPSAHFINRSNVNVNISAIVGKNGSGKSTLLETLYIYCFILSSKKGILKLKEFYQDGVIPEKISNLINRFKVEIIFELNDKVFLVSYYGKSTTCKQLDDTKWKGVRFDFEDFFYTIGINYSLYGNNSIVDEWLTHLFHKNDGYETPIVLNPFRYDGLIDINLEHHLAQSRLLSNITSYEETNPLLIDGKRIDKLDFLLFPADYENLRTFKVYNIIEEFQRFHGFKLYEFIDKVIYEIGGFHLSEGQISNFEKRLSDEREKEGRFYDIVNSPKRLSYDMIEYEVIKYIIRKVYKICWNYKDYRKLFAERDEGEKSNLTERVKTLIPVVGKPNQLGKKLGADRSHITLKLRQAIFSLKSGFFENLKFEIIFDKNQKKFGFKSDMSLEEYTSYVNDLFLNESQIAKIQKVDVIPGAVVRPVLHFLGESQFSSLSSGELQYLHSFHSIIYHLNNLKSVHEDFSERISKSKKNKFSNVNIVLDEIELYFHPDYQRRFINDLLLELGKFNFGKIAYINFLFSTHSPFILSDIPNSNILCLENGAPVPVGFDQKTFGANIHDLLSNQFFLKNGFMGQFAKVKINSLIDFLIAPDKLQDENWDEYRTKEFIGLIGEPLLKLDLTELYIKKFKDTSIVDQQIQELQKLKNYNNDRN